MERAAHHVFCTGLCSGASQLFPAGLCLSCSPHMAHVSDGRSCVNASIGDCMWHVRIIAQLPSGECNALTTHVGAHFYSSAQHSHANLQIVPV
eukprot:7384406-Prymnesium_polylepis.4